MAYITNNDTYICDICGFELAWDSKDDVHGEMWGCELCGDNFCSKCFIDRYGRKEYMRMMQQADQIYCPDCWEKFKKSVAEQENRFEKLCKDFDVRRPAEPPIKKTPWFTVEWENSNDSLNDLLRQYLKNHGYEYLNTINGDVWFLYQGNWCRCEYEVSGSTVQVCLCEFTNNQETTMTYKINITERLREVVEQDADSPEEAEELVRRAYLDGKYVLTAENFLDVTFEAKAEKEKWYAVTRWAVEDVIGSAAEHGITLTPEQADMWWRKNERKFCELLTESGNETLSHMDFTDL